MRKTEPLADTVAVLRGILQRHAQKLQVVVDKPGVFQVASRTLVDRTGRPLFVAAAQIRKSYVSFHLMPIYAVPALQKRMSPALRKRMQGKSCFNVTTMDAGHVKELATLTKMGIEQFEKIDLPWTKPA